MWGWQHHNWASSMKKARFISIVVMYIVTVTPMLSPHPHTSIVSMFYPHITAWEHDGSVKEILEWMGWYLTMPTLPSSQYHFVFMLPFRLHNTNMAALCKDCRNCDAFCLSEFCMFSGDSWLLLFWIWGHFDHFSCLLMLIWRISSHNVSLFFQVYWNQSKCRWSVAVFLLKYGVTMYRTVWGQHSSVWMR